MLNACATHSSHFIQVSRYQVILLKFTSFSLLDSCNILNRTSVGLDLRAETEVALEHGHTYFVFVTAINSAGLSTTSSSNGVTIDTSPPIVQGFLITSAITINQNTIRKNISSDITAASRYRCNISATWNYIIDEESEIKRVSACATTMAEDCNLLAWRDLNPHSLVFGLNFHKPLHSGTVFMVKLQVENGAGLRTIVHSSWVLVDSSPPVKGTVKVNGKETFSLLKDGQPLAASWRDFEDFETGIEEYQWKICSEENISDCVTEFVGIGLKSMIVLNDIGISHGKQYKFVVKAINFVRLETVAVSNSFIFDESSPETGMVFNGADPRNHKLYQSSLTELFARWEGFQDKESGISLYEICIGSIPGLCDVSEFKNVGLTNSTIVSNLNLTHNATYYTTVRASNGAGQTAFASSSGLLIDLTPPIGGKLRDGEDFDTDVTTQDSFVSTNWDEFRDPESEISKYVVCSGTIMGSCDLVSPTTVNNGLAAKLEVQPAISSGTIVYSKLWAYNKAGGVTEIYSDGMVVDNTPPNPGWVCTKSCYYAICFILHGCN